MTIRLTCDCGSKRVTMKIPATKGARKYVYFQCLDCGDRSASFADSDAWLANPFTAGVIVHDGGIVEVKDPDTE